MLYLKVIFILICVFLSSSEIFGQVYFSPSVESYYDDNIYNNYLGVSDFVHNFSGELGYDIESERNNFELYYFGNYSHFVKEREKSSTFHKAGLVNTFLLAEDDNPLNVGLNYLLKDNQGDFYIYDFNQVSAYANYMHSFSETDKFQLGVIGNRIEYDNFSLFSHYQLKAFIRSINNFKSNTSLITGIEIDDKSYIEKLQQQGLTDNILQAKLYLQLGQSLNDNFGASGYVFLRKNLESGNRYFNDEEFIYYEEEIFNDVYSNEGIETGLSFTYMFSPSVIGKIAGTYQIRKFTDLPAVDIAGNELDEFRQDKQFSVGTSVEFGLGRILNGLFLTINYNYIVNSSNDYYYDYTNNLFAIGLGFDF